MNTPQFFGTSGKLLSPYTDAPNNYANLIGWWKADSLIGTYVDADPVASWSDSSGSGRTATQGTSGNKPVFKTNIYNGKPCVRFDGSNDFLTLASTLSPASNSGAWAVIGIGKVSTANLTNALLGGGSSGDYFCRQSYPPGTGDRIIYRIFALSSGDKVSSGFTTGETSLTMFTYTKIAADGAGAHYYDAATAKASQGAYELSFSIDRIGNDSGSNFYPWKGDICEICFYQRDITSAISSLYNNYFKPKWGLA